MKGIFGVGLALLQRAIKVRQLKNTVISANIANVDTPGYKARHVPFREVMSRYLGDKKEGLDLVLTNPAHLNPKSPAKLSQSDGWDVVQAKETGTPNNVDIDVEMARLAENNLQYQATLQALIRELELLKNAVTEGGRP